MQFKEPSDRRMTATLQWRRIVNRYGLLQGRFSATFCYNLHIL